LNRQDAKFAKGRFVNRPYDFPPKPSMKPAMTGKVFAVAEKFTALPQELVAVFAAIRLIRATHVSSCCCRIRFAAVVHDDDGFEWRLLLLPLLLR
jgi:hypothetical protein